MVKEKGNNQGYIKLKDLHFALKEAGIMVPVESLRDLKSHLSERNHSDIEVMGQTDAIEGQGLQNAIYDTTYEVKE